MGYLYAVVYLSKIKSTSLKRSYINDFLVESDLWPQPRNKYLVSVHSFIKANTSAFLFSFNKKDDIYIQLPFFEQVVYGKNTCQDWSLISFSVKARCITYMFRSFALPYYRLFLCHTNSHSCRSAWMDQYSIDGYHFQWQSRHSDHRRVRLGHVDLRLTRCSSQRSVRKREDFAPLHLVSIESSLF